MMLVPCPWCGPRNVAEFRYVGERRARPDPSTADAAAWRGYLYLQVNPAGWVEETWYHRAGCRQYFVADRHTVDNQIRASRPPDAQLRGFSAEQTAGRGGEHDGRAQA
ncbi:MAG: sarcosine oxidase subunit delta [Actinomycetota bacterium]|jgi:heterotetrameric sarcosine oxidase delta subunit|nr:sarcosine oxidase subunit delta [Actinomycetota bacterium]